MKVLIIGDVMIDAYLIGNVERISPEAPVPVVTVTKKENRLGGAANVALNIQALGASPLLCSVIGNDEGAKNFLHVMKKNNMKTDGIITSGKRMTTVKTRVIGGKHQMLRVDEEIDDILSKEETKQLFQKISSFITKEKINAIIFEDYDKGVITPELIEQVVTLSKNKNIPVVVDPKRKNFKEYKNVTLFKPNLRELLNGLKLDFEGKDFDQLKKVLKTFQQKQNIDIALLTLSEDGMLVSGKNIQKTIPAHIRSIADVSGAGDTVISVASLCLAAGISIVDSASIANLAGGLVCEKVGVVPIEKKQLLDEAIENYSK